MNNLAESFVKWIVELIGADVVTEDILIMAADLSHDLYVKTGDIEMYLINEEIEDMIA